VSVATYLKRLVAPILNAGPSRDALPEWPRGTSVPRIIHQTFPTKALPAALQASVDAMRALNPDWEYNLYDDADVEAFVERHYGTSMLQRYRRINPRYGAARADLFRYLLLYKEGGVYLDIKSTTRSPLSKVLRADDAYLLSQWRNETGGRFRKWGLYHDLSHIPGGEFQQWFIVAAPGHPLLRAVILNVLRNLRVYSPDLHGAGRIAVLRTTGPIAYTLAIAPHLSRHPHRIVESDTDLALEYTIFPKFKDHGQLFTTHYAAQEDSIVTLGAVQRLTSRTAGLLRRLWHRTQRSA
jgi:hypothetical protein